MNKKEKGQMLVIAGLLTLLLVNTLYFRHRFDTLEAELQYLRGAVSGVAFDDVGLENRIMEELKKGASILDSALSRLFFQNDKLMVEVSIVPKTLHVGDQYFIVSGENKVEARTLDGVSYVSYLPYGAIYGMDIYAVIQSEGRTLQEKLPEIQVEDYLSVEISSVGLQEEDKELSVVLFADAEDSKIYLQSLKNITAVILSEDNEEIRRVPMDGGTEVEIHENLEVDKLGKAYTFLIPKDLFDFESFRVLVELKNYGVTLTSDQIYYFSKSGFGSDGLSGSKFSVSFEE